MSRSRNAGPWLLSAGLIGLLLVHAAEFLYPGYSASNNFISDLGAGPEPSRTIFVIALLLSGAFILVAAYLLRKERTSGQLWWLVAIAGTGTIMVAIFDERSFMVGNLPVIHTIAAVMGFIAGNVAAIYSSKLAHPPLAQSWIALGVMGLVALALYILGSVDEMFLLGLGLGGMERLIFYPGMLWAITYGTALMASERPLNVFRVS